MFFQEMLGGVLANFHTLLFSYAIQQMQLASVRISSYSVYTHRIRDHIRALR
jgi:hypothetical protein